MEGDEKKRRRNMEAGTRCGRPESLRTGLKASTWTSMVKATRNEGKLKITEVKEKRQEEEAKNLKVQREKLIRVESEETQDYVREAKGRIRRKRRNCVSYRVRSVFRKS